MACPGGYAWRIVCGLAVVAGAQIAFAANDAALRAAYEDAIRQLDSDSFFVREQATRWLQEQGSAAIPMLVEAAGGDNLEVTCRAIQVLRDLSIGADLDTADAAGVALRELAESTVTSASQRAAWALRSQDLLRSKRAMSEVLKLGAVLDNGDTFQGQTVPRLLVSKTWTGGDEGLAYLKWLTSSEFVSVRCSKVTDASVPHLKALTHLSRLELYGTRISDEGLQELQQALPATTIDRRAGGLLGIKGLSNEQGCEIGYVKPESAAESAGLEVGDVIVQFDKQPIDTFESLTAIISKRAGGDKVPLQYLRNGELRKADVVLGEWE